ncbi:MAG: DUF4175 domain-containing protein [Saprospiraceae bacterium]|nr:DUF4175 domain-containing protein [Saprospiraceae bacterium]
MAKQLSNYDHLINKLDQFIRKFYLNQLIRGILYSIASILGLFLLFSLLENQFYFDTGVRKLIFFGFIGVSALTIGLFIFMPLLKYFKLGKQINHEKAASIIGNHFGDVKDKLLNVLQLKKQSAPSASQDLINASINQKTESIKLVPFKSAIDLMGNKKYLKYAMPPAFLLLAILLASPTMITKPTHRIINNGVEFERDAPFHFNIENDDLDVVQYDDVKITASITGTALPNEVFIDVDNFQYRMKKEANNIYSYVFKNVQKNQSFELFSGRVRSQAHELNVLLKPNLTEFDLYLDYPSYIGRKDETISNIGDVLIPQGTKINWNFNADNTDAVSLMFASENKIYESERKSDTRYRFTKRIMKDDLYKIYFSNEMIPSPDSVTYNISVSPDEYPEIKVESFKDSIESNLVYFIGNASDDYGLVSINFHKTVTRADGTQSNTKEVISNPKSREQQYDYTFDISELELQPGEKVSYYFETFDNDGVNGSKSAKTNIMQFEKPTLEEFEELEDLNEEEIKDKLEESIKESRKIKEELRKLREKMLQKQKPDWEDKKELEKLMERQKEMQNELKKAQEKFKENLKNQEEFSEQKEEIKEKQEKLQKMFEEMMDTETQELMQKIEELMEELNKEDMVKEMENMEMNEQAMEKNLERLNELFKNLEMEKEIKDMIEKLEEMAEKQEELSEETAKEEKSQEELKEEQEKLNEEFEKAQEKMEEMKEKNEELERPKDMGEDPEEQMEDIKDDMEDSQESLEKKENKSASKKQKSASEKMKEMAQGMQSAMESGEMEQMEEDIAALRQLLENLVTLSFDQEDLITEIRYTTINTPSYVLKIQDQFKLKDDFQLIRDSLYALAKRNDKIESFVTEKVVDIESDIEMSIDELEDRKKPEADMNQRRAMKNVNDLALMLSESMEQMQQQMSGMMAGSQMCNKPGGLGAKPGDVPIDKISEGQQKLNEGMKKMMDGKGKEGGNSAKDFAEKAAQQAALRKALEGLQQEKMEQGKGSKGLQEIIDGMDKIESDLVNKRLDNDMLLRQQDILTRLLEAEKADREREYDNKRKAEVGKDAQKELPPALKEYLRERETEIEMYKKVSPALRPYYKKLVDDYYKALKNSK